MEHDILLYMLGKHREGLVVDFGRTGLPKVDAEFVSSMLVHVVSDSLNLKLELSEWALKLYPSPLVCIELYVSKLSPLM